MPLDERLDVNANEVAVILGALNALKRGDASVRLPVAWPGTLGRLADAFNDVVDRNARMAQELERLSRVVGKEGKLGRRGTLGDVSGFWRDSIDAVNLLIDDLVHPTSEIARVIGAVAQGDLSQTMALEVEGRPLQGEFLRTAKTVNKMVDQLGSFAAEVTRVAREVGTEGKLGGQAEGEGRRRHVEGPHRLRELDGRQPDRAGAQHRRGDHRRRDGRPVEEDHRRREGRVPRAQEHDQHDGRSAPLVRLGSDARRTRGGHRRQARRPGAGRGRVRHVERPDRVGELDGVEPHGPGAQHRRRDDGRRERATCRRRSPSTRRARSSSSRTPSTRWSISSPRSRRK